VKVVKVIPKQFVMDRLVAPKTVPKEVKMIQEEDGPATGVVGGVPGGVPGGTAGGVLGGIIGGLPSAAPPPPPPPPKPATPKSIRVGGNVQQANLIRQVRPQYPPLAKAARVQGTVKFEAVIAKDGSIQNLKVVSGPPLLVNAALEAVKQWQYKPTLLNGEPVEVITTIDVNFTLSQ
jgi:protein TonB